MIRRVSSGLCCQARSSFRSRSEAVAVGPSSQKRLEEKKGVQYLEDMKGEQCMEVNMTYSTTGFLEDLKAGALFAVTVSGSLSSAVMKGDDTGAAAAVTGVGSTLIGILYLSRIEAVVSSIHCMSS